MLQNASYLIRFLATLILTIVLVASFRPLSRKLSQKLSPEYFQAAQLIIIGFVPLLAGLLLNGFMMVFQNVVLPFDLISGVAWAGWATIARSLEPKVKSTLKLVFFQNLVPAVVLILIAIQQVGIRRFWSGIAGAWSQTFYLPVLNLGYFLTSWSTALFPAYIASFLLLVTASFVGCRSSNRKREGQRSMPAITWLLIGSVLGTWLVSMVCLTVGTAQYVMQEVVSEGKELAGRADLYSAFSSLYDGESGAEFRREHPGTVDYRMLNAIDNVGVTVTTPGLDVYPGRDESNLYRDTYAYCQTAAVFTDSEGRIIHQSGDFLYFSYVTADVWRAQEEEVAERGYGWIDLSDEQDTPQDTRYEFLRIKYAGVHSLYDYAALRITGYFYGSRIEPLALAILSEDSIRTAVDDIMEKNNTDYVEYSLSALDAEGRVEWDVRFDRTASVPVTRDLVTIYALHPDMMVYDPGGSFTFNGWTYDSLLAYLSQPFEPFSPAGYSSSEFHLTRTTVFDYRFFYDHSNNGPDTAAKPREPEYVLMTAVTANPVLIAISFLRNVYIVTFALALIALLFIRGAVKKHLVKPLAEINAAITNNWANVETYWDKPPKWRESRELVEHYQQTQDTLRVQKNEITRLNTALEYAKTAEQNRRQMTSNIAHELKTPLAVIHSYAEGLKEHIAEDKRDKYIDVILAEAERTDGMVLEMLDLSRLEAGKVKLSRDDFSLVILTRSIFEKLEMAAQEKKLQIEFLFPEDFTTITADESRIAQVIENFATNAIKYTPVGGHILVKIQTGRSGITFSIENDSEPLSSEALSKVWDTFYRTDEARSGGGTGLGLAIAKNIVELHGGKCSVQNTKTGVEFSFTI